MTIVNEGDVAGTAQIVVDGTVNDVPTVAPGETVVERIPLGSEPIDVSVVGLAGVIAAERAAPCLVPTPDIDADLRVDCDTTEVVVLLENDGTAAGDVRVVVGDDRTDLLLEPGEALEIRRPTSGDTTQVSVSTGGVLLIERTLQTSCTKPAPRLDADIVVACSGYSGLATITVVNDGDAAGTVTVTVGEIERVLEVPAGETVVTSATTTDVVDVMVTTAEGTLLASWSGTDPCVSPASSMDATVLVDCIDGNVIVTATNDGTLSGTVFVEVDGGTPIALVVDPGTTGIIEVGFMAGVDKEIVVHDGDRLLVRESLPDACATPEPVLSATQRVDCSADYVFITLTNDGDAAGTVTIVLGEDRTIVMVDAGDTLEVDMPLPPGGASLTITTGADEDPAVVLSADLVPCGSRGAAHLGDQRAGLFHWRHHRRDRQHGLVARYGTRRDRRHRRDRAGPRRRHRDPVRSRGAGGHHHGPRGGRRPRPARGHDRGRLRGRGTDHRGPGAGGLHRTRSRGPVGQHGWERGRRRRLRERRAP